MKNTQNQVKEILVEIISIICILVAIAFITKTCKMKTNTATKDKVISLPEEMQLTQLNNRLLVEKVTNDTIELGYDHYSYVVTIEYDTIVVSSNDKVIHKEALFNNPSSLARAIVEDNK